MASWRLLVVLLVIFIVLDELDAQRNSTRPVNRRNPNRSNRNRPRAGRTRARGRRRNVPLSPCEEIQVPMCKGMVGYTHTRLPNRFNHTTQLQVYRVLEHLWAQIDIGCSQNFRLLACALYLPRCAGRGPAREPCRKTCKLTQRKCQSRLRERHYNWPDQFDCNTLPKKRCLKHVPHQPCTVDYTLCQEIDLPMCQGLTFTRGMSPNMFGQCNRTQIGVEMDQFRPLVEGGCSDKLSFFMCGVYMPFCTPVEGEMSFPCRELCEEVRSSCESAYRVQTGGLPWPNKFQCHRYPSAFEVNSTCVMPNVVTTVSLT